MSQHNEAYIAGMWEFKWPNYKINGEKNKNFKVTVVVLFAQY